jgi:hypothetical protein
MFERRAMSLFGGITLGKFLADCSEVFGERRHEPEVYNSW